MYEATIYIALPWLQSTYSLSGLQEYSNNWSQTAVENAAATVKHFKSLSMSLFGCDRIYVTDL
jgi:hypothetical protein